MRRFISLFVFTTLSIGIGVAAENHVDLSVLSKTRFEPNVGQAGSSKAKFVARMGTSIVPMGPDYIELPVSQERSSAPVRLRFAGANRKPQMEGVNESRMKVNYFRGNRNQWRTGVPTFSALRYRQLYAGIDLLIHADATGRGLEYDFEVAPLANPDLISMRFDGAKQVRLSADGSDIVITTATGEFRQRKPVAYQIVNGVRAEVSAKYRVNGTVTTLELGAYRKDLALTIDPALIYSTVLNGPVAGDGAIATSTALYTDSTGHTYAFMGGIAPISDLPLKNAYRSVPSLGFVARFDTSLSDDASAIFVSYFDGVVNGIATDSAGNLYVVGGTDSASFPIVNGYASSGGAFLAKLSAEGTNLLYSTKSGSSGVWKTGPLCSIICVSAGNEAFVSVAVSADGTAYVAGNTSAKDVPLINPLRGYQPNVYNTNMFLQIVNTNSSGPGSLMYSSYFSASAMVSAVATDATKRAYISGSTSDPNFPAVHGITNAVGTNSGGYPIATPFIAVIDPAAMGAAQLVYSTTLFGSGGIGSGNAIAVDGSSNVSVAGRTSDPLIATPGAYQTQIGSCYGRPCDSAFIAKINPSLNGPASLLAATYLSSGDLVAGNYGKSEEARAITLDTSGNVYVAGASQSQGGFPLLNPATRWGNGVFQTTDRGTTWNQLSDPGLSSFHDSLGSTLAVDPTTSPSILYLGSASGISKSVDGGLSWAAANNGLSCTSVMSLALVPGNPSALFASTTAGVFTSTDGGGTWTAANEGLDWFSGQTCSDSNGPFQLAVDGNLVYLTGPIGNGQLYRRPASGTSWSNLNVSSTDVAFDTNTTPHTIYAANWQGAAFVSVDDGATWQEIASQGWDEADGVAVDSSTNPSTIWILNADGQTNALFKSSDGGATFIPVGNGLVLWHSRLAFDSTTTPSTIYASGNGVPGVFVSVDGGLNFSGGSSGAIYSNPIIGPIPAGGSAPPVYVANISPSINAFIAEFDNSLSHLKFSTLIGGFAGAAQANSIAIDPSANLYMAGATTSDYFPELNGYSASPRRNGAFVSVIGTPTLPASSSGPVSTTVGTSTGTLAVTLPNITGSTTSSAPTVNVTPLDSTATASFSLSNNLGAFDISTTATFTGSATLCFQVLTVNDPSTFNALTLLHVVNGVSVNITSSYDFTTRTICGTTSSFSPFIVVKGALGQLQDLVKYVNQSDLRHGLQTSLDAKLQNAESGYSSAVGQDYNSVCNMMGSFINNVLAQTGQAITTSESQQMIASARQIKATLGCAQ